MPFWVRTTPNGPPPHRAVPARVVSGLKCTCGRTNHRGYRFRQARTALSATQPPTRYRRGGLPRGGDLRDVDSCTDAAPDVREAAVCNPPPQPAGSAPTNLGEQVSRTDMTDVAPAKLSDTKVHVLNASGRGGQAADIAGALQIWASPSRPPPTTRSMPAPGWTAKARSASVRRGKPPLPHYGW